MRTVEFRGEDYRIAEKIGLAPLMRFGKLAKTGGDSGDMTALSVMYDVIEQCFASQCEACKSWDQEALLTRNEEKACCEKRALATVEFDRFMDRATEERWDHEEILEVVGEVMKVLSARPTGRSSGSSGGPTTEPARYEDDLSLRAQRRLEESGRADLAVAVLNRRDYMAASQAG